MPKKQIRTIFTNIPLLNNSSRVRKTSPALLGLKKNRRHVNLKTERSVAYKTVFFLLINNRNEVSHTDILIL